MLYFLSFIFFFPLLVRETGYKVFVVALKWLVCTFGKKSKNYNGVNLAHQSWGDTNPRGFVKNKA